MEKTAAISETEKVTDLNYLSETMDGNKKMIREVMEVFLKQAPEELSKLNKAVDKMDYPSIKSLSHKMKSSVSIMGITALNEILAEMEELSKSGKDLEKIKTLNNEVNEIYKQGIEEIEKEIPNYV
jgi:HPt (histidine-containing phosphotransfer) domain-containing protein